MAFSIAATPCMPRTVAAPALRRAARCSSAAAASTKFDLRNYWTSLIKEVDQKLNDAVPLKHPELIREAMRYSLLAKTAKRAPPVLCIAACELFGGERSAAFPTACALEMVHTASQIHDDLPYIDDSASRGGQPSSHELYGTDIAVLAGDALFSRAFHHIVSETPSQLIPQARLLRVVEEIARSVGSSGMSAGRFEGGGKYSDLGRCSAVCGGLLGGASDEEIERLREYGRIVGVLHRVVEDDILEGKTDSEKAMEVAEELKSRAKKELAVFENYGDKVLPLLSFVDYAAERL